MSENTIKPQNLEKLHEMVRALCKIQSAIHSIDRLQPSAPFYKMHRKRMKMIEMELSDILNETTELFGQKTTDSFNPAVKMIDDVAKDIYYAEI